ncbi:MAG: colicin V synthesis protein [Burkholderiales bacterium PBB4]|nr:MAG: colicin V synthesis protein [Burkholderiales bacterium PBB4]
MVVVDWIFLGTLLVSMLVGAWRGLVFEMISVGSWIAAFVLAQWFAPAVAHWLPISSDNEALRYGLGFLMVFVGTIFAGGLIAFVVKKLLAAVGLSPADRMLGAIFGVVRGIVILLALTLIAGMTPLKSSPWWQEAQGTQLAGRALHGLKPVLPEDFGKYIP